MGLSPLLILTPCGPERVLVVSTEPPDDLSCLTTPGVGRPGDGAVARAVDQVHPDAHAESRGGGVDLPPLKGALAEGRFGSRFGGGWGPKARRKNRSNHLEAGVSRGEGVQPPPYPPTPQPPTPNPQRC